MSKVLKVCPFCGSEAVRVPGGEYDRCYCSNAKCPEFPGYMSLTDWNTRPIEDALRKQLEVALAELDYLEPRTDEYVKASIIKTLEEINRIGGMNE